MELKVFRDVLPAAGADCTAKAELPLETELLISDYLPPVQRIVKCFAKPVVLQKQLAPGRLTLEGYLRCTVYYQGEEGAGLCQTEQKLPFTKALELPSLRVYAGWEGGMQWRRSSLLLPKGEALAGRSVSCIFLAKFMVYLFCGLARPFYGKGGEAQWSLFLPLSCPSQRM